LEEIEKSW